MLSRHAKRFARAVLIIMLLIAIGWGAWKWAPWSRPAKQTYQKLTAPETTRNEPSPPPSPVPTSPPPIDRKSVFLPSSVSHPATVPDHPSHFPSPEPAPQHSPVHSAPAPGPASDRVAPVKQIDMGYTWGDGDLIDDAVFTGQPGQGVELLKVDLLELSREQNIYLYFPVEEISRKMEAEFGQKPKILWADLHLTAKAMSFESKLNIRLSGLLRNLKEENFIPTSKPLAISQLSQGKSPMVLTFNVTEEFNRILREGINFGWVLHLPLEEMGKVAIASARDENADYIPRIKLKLSIQKNLVPAETVERMKWIH